jgi:hypothetical protein
MSRPARFPELRGSVRRDGYTFLHDQAYYALREHFKVQSLDGFGAERCRLQSAPRGDRALFEE